MRPTKSNEQVSPNKFWQKQYQNIFISLCLILVVSILFALANIFAKNSLSLYLSMGFIVLIPIFACYGLMVFNCARNDLQTASEEYEKVLATLKEVEDSQVTLDRFMSISSDLMAVAGTDGKLKKVSASLIKTLGFSEEELLSRPFFEFIHPEDREATKKNIELLHLGFRSIGFENRYITAQGTYRILSWSAAADNEVGVRYASARDVTDERDFQIRMQQVIDAAPVLLIVKNRDGQITNCNTAFASSLGLQRSVLIGKKLEDFLSLTHADNSHLKDLEVLSSGKPITYEELLMNNGKDEWHLATVYPIRDQSGDIVSIGKVALNIHAQRTLTKQIDVERSRAMLNAKLASIGELAAGIAHEINNPLAIIEGQMSLLDRHMNEPEKWAQRSASIKKSVSRISHIVKGLKHYSRTNSTRVRKLESLAHIISESLILTEWKAKKFAVTLNVELNTVEMIHCDPIEIEQVLVNLINNGIEAVKEEPVRELKIELNKESDSLIVRVIDSGPGLSTETEEKMFDPFFTTKPVGEGTGLGLSIAKGIVDSHGASLSLNRHNPGTCFEIRFPQQ
ncbi:sensor histidine kinase [Bdellovibrio reynosensis]|uniref:histidine kinase n=1 Tax=Bdellovibrio reynosensis TaxID=2835041 RepID=A0ABY4CBY7_9BACT|nr:PAS domain-containing sensor histidine kinase [Bdellovibrio reynosensis]UOF02457.1 PAS domain S-box protein [Bdellovibrio reynosensis]